MLTTTVRAPAGGALARRATYDSRASPSRCPTVMPSYNQIGFDSLHYLLGTVQIARGRRARVDDRREGPRRRACRRCVDPATQAIFPLAFDLASDLRDVERGGRPPGRHHELHAAVPVVPAGARRSSRAARRRRPRSSPGARCARRSRPTGPFLEQLGLCNPQTDVIRVLGASNVAAADGHRAAARRGHGRPSRPPPTPSPPPSPARR